MFEFVKKLWKVFSISSLGDSVPKMSSPSNTKKKPIQTGQNEQIVSVLVRQLKEGEQYSRRQLKSWFLLWHFALRYLRAKTQWRCPKTEKAQKHWAQRKRSKVWAKWWYLVSDDSNKRWAVKSSQGFLWHLSFAIKKLIWVNLLYWSLSIKCKWKTIWLFKPWNCLDSLPSKFSHPLSDQIFWDFF